MRLLLDTSALIWFWLCERPLATKVFAAITDLTKEVVVSPISAMEIATKHRVGKPPGVETILATFDAALAIDGFLSLPLTRAQALLAGSIPGEDRDPFDRMLAARARIEDLTIVSPDTAFDALGARRLW